MSIENEVLSAAIKEGSFKSFADRGIDERFFEDEVIRKGYKAIFDFWVKYDKFPDTVTVKRLCPDVTLPTVSEPTKFYTDQLYAKYRENIVRTSLRKVADLLGKDSETAITEVEALTIKLSESRQSRDVKLLSSTESRKKKYLERKKHGGITGISTGLPSLDNALGGLNKEDFILIAGRPKIGKTFMLLFFAKAIREAMVKCLVFTKEMSISSMQTRLESMMFGLPYSRFKHGKLTDAEERDYFKSLDELGGEDLIFVQDANTVGAIVAKAKEYKPEIILLDGLYLLEDLRGKSPWERITNISRDIKRAAQMLQIPIVATHQLNRGTDDKKPMMDNLAYADALAQDADAVMALYQNQSMREDKELYLRLIGSRESDRLTMKLRWDLENMDIKEEKLDKDGKGLGDEDFLAAGPVGEELTVRGKRR